MALNPCSIAVDPTGRELVAHGTTAFPIACYHNDFRKTDVPWHWHQELEAAIITQGRCTVAAGGEKLVLQAGEGFFINSGVLHGAWDPEDTGCVIHSVVFHPRLVGGSPDSVFHRDFIQPLTAHPALEITALSPHIPWQQEALESIKTAWQLCAEALDGYPFRTRSALSELIFQLHSHMPLREPQNSRHAARDTDRIKTMLSYIHEHFGSELSTSAIAASAMVSESECLRCFRNAIGTTPIQYLKQYRLQQAAELLSSTQERVSDIAATCGFQDMSYFSKSFRELKGCTPTQFRSVEGTKDPDKPI